MADIADYLQPRMLVLDKYPNSPFTVGAILVQAQAISGARCPNLWTLKGGKDRTALIEHPEIYPNLFKVLSWWELVPLDQLPQYVRINETGRVCEVSRYRLVSQTVVLSGSILCLYLFNVTPATHEDFINDTLR